MNAMLPSRQSPGLPHTRIIIARSPKGAVVEMDPLLALRARLAIRRRRDEETELKVAA